MASAALAVTLSPVMEGLSLGASGGSACYNPSSSSSIAVTENIACTDTNTKPKKNNTKEPRQPKIVLRRLPPTITQEELIKFISPMPEISYSYFTVGDVQFSNNNLQYSRAYFTLVNESEVISFYNRLDGLPLNYGGKVYRIVAEYAPFQRSHKKRKPDSKEDTIANDPDYIAFLNNLEETKEKLASNSIEDVLETCNKKHQEVGPTPLIQHIINKRNRMSDKMAPRELRAPKKKSNYGNYQNNNNDIIIITGKDRLKTKHGPPAKRIISRGTASPDITPTPIPTPPTSILLKTPQSDNSGHKLTNCNNNTNNTKPSKDFSDNSSSDSPRYHGPDNFYSQDAKKMPAKSDYYNTNYYSTNTKKSQYKKEPAPVRDGSNNSAGKKHPHRGAYGDSYSDYNHRNTTRYSEYDDYYPSWREYPGYEHSKYTETRPYKENSYHYPEYLRERNNASRRDGYGEDYSNRQQQHYSKTNKRVY